MRLVIQYTRRRLHRLAKDILPTDDWKTLLGNAEDEYRQVRGAFETLFAKAALKDLDATLSGIRDLRDAVKSIYKITEVGPLYSLGAHCDIWTISDSRATPTSGNEPQPGSEQLESILRA